MTKLTFILSAIYSFLIVTNGVKSIDKIFNISQDDNLHRNLITINLIGSHSIPLVELNHMITKMKLNLATGLWSPRPLNLTAGHLALYSQALKASCHDPFDFYGQNVVHKMAEMAVTTKFERQLVDLTLCILSNSSEQFKNLMGSRLASIVEAEHSMDMDTMTIRSLLFTCYLNLEPNLGHVRHEMADILARIFSAQEANGSFRNSIITTALVLQAATVSGLQRFNYLWNRKSAVEFINGKSADRLLNPLEAYYVVPAFHEPWSSISCKEYKDSSQMALSSAEDSESIWTPFLNWFTGSKTVPETLVNLSLSRWVMAKGNGTKVALTTAQGSSVLHALQEAALLHSDFVYKGTESSHGFYLTSVGQVAESLGDKAHWMIYQVDANGESVPLKETMGKKVVNDGDHYALWFHQVDY
ncbi:Cobalamin binding intrinsic factor [Halotydeus destructor]|nr:Cobalamin binding intrinsic factor [Halotydeus destructor]